MNKKELEQLLRTQKEHFVADISDKIQDIKKMNINNIPNEPRKKYLKLPLLKIAASLCILVISFISMYYIFFNQSSQNAVHALYIDVNPSIKLEIDDNDNVINVELLNTDAQMLFDATQLKGENLQNILDIIIEKLHTSGYFEEIDSEIILSMGDFEQESLIQSYLDKLSAVLSKRLVQCTVIKNRFTQKEQERIKENAGQNGNISPGKLKYINEIMQKKPDADLNELKDIKLSHLRMINDILENDPTQSLDELKNLSENELKNKFLEKKNSNKPGNNGNPHNDQETGRGQKNKQNP